MAKGDDRREAVKYLGDAYKKHLQQTGTALPDSRSIEKRVADAGRRNDRQDSDRKK
jgi:hypothetical protein